MMHTIDSAALDGLLYPAKETFYAQATQEIEGLLRDITLSESEKYFAVREAIDMSDRLYQVLFEAYEDGLSQFQLDTLQERGLADAETMQKLISFKRPPRAEVFVEPGFAEKARVKIKHLWLGI